MNLLIIGAPGTGKGTMSALIKEEFGVVHVSTGDMLREAINSKSDIGNKAKEYMDKGMLVPDEIIHDIIIERFNKDDIKNGFLFDGYPRTVAQAKDLDSILSACNKKIDRVLDLCVDDKVLEERITGRRICSNCKAIYHIKNKPSKVIGKCDVCGSDLLQRKDDTLEALDQRLKSYHELTKPVIDYYKEKDLVSNINADQSPEKVFEDIKGILEEVA